MADMTETLLEALIARLEAATGPDRDLDAKIFETVTGQSSRVAVPAFTDSSKTVHKYMPGLPAYTASLDAALSLVPEGWTRAVDATVPEMGIDVDLSPLVHDGEYDGVRGTHRHEAIATCIAALKARALAALTREEG